MARAHCRPAGPAGKSRKQRQASVTNDGSWVTGVSLQLGKHEAAPASRWSPSQSGCPGHCPWVCSLYVCPERTAQARKAREQHGRGSVNMASQQTARGGQGRRPESRPVRDSPTHFDALNRRQCFVDLPAWQLPVRVPGLPLAVLGPNIFPARNKLGRPVDAPAVLINTEVGEAESEAGRGRHLGAKLQGAPPRRPRRRLLPWPLLEPAWSPHCGRMLSSDRTRVDVTCCIRPWLHAHDAVRRWSP